MESVLGKKCLLQDVSSPKYSLLRTWPLHSGKHPPLTSPQKFRVPLQLCLLIKNILKLMATWKHIFSGTLLSGEWPLCGKSPTFGNLRGCECNLLFFVLGRGLATSSPCAGEEVSRRMT